VLRGRVVLGRLGRYLAREVVLAWLAVTAVLVVVLLTNRLVDFLTEAVNGDVPADAVFTLLGLKAVGAIGKVLPASFFLGIMLGLGRLYRDAEMTAMIACGAGPTRIYRAVYALALPLTGLVALLSLYVSPWAERQAEQTLLRAQQEAQFQGIAPGRFTRLGDDQAVAYVSEVGDDGLMEGVFARLRSQAGERLVTAATARRHVTDDGHKYLVLNDGERYDLPADEQSGWRILAFAEHGVRLGDRGQTAAERRPEGDELATTALWRRGEPKDLAELHWRLAMPVAALVLAFIALPLSATGSRQGRYGKLLAAVLICALYLNLLKAGQDWLEDDAAPLLMGLWWVHALFLAVGMVLLFRQYGPRVLGRRR